MANGGWCPQRRRRRRNHGSTGGDIVTIASYSDFELTADFKIPAKGKSAIKYYVGPTSAEEPGAAIGLEYHLVDDVLHPDGKIPSEHWDHLMTWQKFRAAIEQSKYKGVAGFGEVKEVHILLQDHGYPVCFRNLKIRVSRNKN